MSEDILPIYSHTSTREVSVRATLESLSRQLEKVGITRLAELTALDTLGIPVVAAIRPNGKHLSSSQGKGVTLDEAKASAIMEGIETYHAENLVNEILDESYYDLEKSLSVIKPSTLKSNLNYKFSDYETKQFSWIEAVNVFTNKSFMVPSAICNLDSSLIGTDYWILGASSNGLAAGNTLYEAKLHALCELIERDSLFRWQKMGSHKQCYRRLKIQSIRFDSTVGLIDKVTLGKCSIAIWDVTSVIGVPAFHCAIYDPSSFRRVKLHTGTGCHLSREIAINRAITEAAQCRLTYISGSRDDVFEEYYEANTKVSDDFFSRKYELLECMPEDNIYGLSMERQFDLVLSRLEDSSITDILTINLTKKDIGIPVVKMFSPMLAFNGVRM